MFSPDDSPLEIEVLLMPEATLIALSSVIEPLRAANRQLGRRAYRWRIVSADGQPVRTASEVAVPVTGMFDPSGTVPLVVIASYAVESTDPALVRRLARAQSRSAIGGVEAGVWLLARAGLLNGRRATTHPEDLDEFAARFPAVETVPDRFVVDGPRFTAAAASPALDLMLELVRLRQGLPLAIEIAKLFGFDRASPMAPRIGRVVSRTPPLDRAIREMDANLEDPLPVAAIARAARVSARHLQTLFRTRLGVTPYAFYQTLRLNRARQMLAETRMPALEIAAATGFTSPAAFSRAYRKQHGESPSETRARVNG